MTVQQVEVLVRHLFAVHLLDFVGQQLAVQADEVRLGEFADQRGDVLVLYVRIRVVFAAGSRVRRVAVVDQETELVAYFPVFETFVAVDHE